MTFPSRMAIKRMPWTQTQLEWLEAMFPHRSTAEVAKFIGRSEGSCYNKAAQLGIKKCPEYLASAACRFSKGHTKSKGTQFVKGHKTWNKGISFISGGRSAETQFKKGQKSHTWRPIGTEVWRDGYLCRKVRDGKPTHKNYAMVHVLMWEEVNGPVPKGHVIVFRDKDTKNLVIENLECLTRQENMARNTIHNYSPELKSLIRLGAKLKRKVAEHEKHQ